MGKNTETHNALCITISRTTQIFSSRKETVPLKVPWFPQSENPPVIKIGDIKWWKILGRGPQKPEMPVVCWKLSSQDHLQGSTPDTHRLSVKKLSWLKANLIQEFSQLRFLFPDDPSVWRADKDTPGHVPQCLVRGITSWSDEYEWSMLSRDVLSSVSRWFSFIKL